jgi:hypothetical protein
VQEKYLRGVLGVERETSSYIVREEGKMNRLRVMDGREECRIIIECWRKKKTRRRRERNSTNRETGMPVKKWKD